MKKLSTRKLQNLADKSGISISSHDGGSYPTLAQLAAFASEVQALCASECLKIAQKHAVVEGARASGQKAGALECHEALRAGAAGGIANKPAARP